MEKLISDPSSFSIMFLVLFPLPSVVTFSLSFIVLSSSTSLPCSIFTYCILFVRYNLALVLYFFYAFRSSFIVNLRFCSHQMVL
jgi:hypothetical protein